MRLREVFRFTPDGKCVSFVGAGGKTTLLFKIAHELCEEGLKCLIMTSTHIYKPTSEQAFTITEHQPDSEKALTVAIHSRIPVAIGTYDSTTGKLSLPPADLLAAAWDQADWVLVEADGSRHYPIKFPACYEPMIYEPSHRVIAVAGLSALGKSLSQVCHRANLASDFLDVSIDTPVTPLMLARMLTSEQGQFKNVGDPSRFSIFLNQADDDPLLELASETNYYIKKIIPDCSVAAGSLKNNLVQIF